MISDSELGDVASGCAIGSSGIIPCDFAALDGPAMAYLTYQTGVRLVQSGNDPDPSRSRLQRPVDPEL